MSREMRHAGHSRRRSACLGVRGGMLVGRVGLCSVRPMGSTVGRSLEREMMTRAIDGKGSW
jgi:hypothetical protein